MPRQDAPVDWVCRWCKAQDGTSFLNFGWKKSCGKCRISKSMSHGGPARPQDPTQSPTRSLATMAARRAKDSMAVTASISEVWQRSSGSENMVPSTNLGNFPCLDMPCQSSKKKQKHQPTQARTVLGDITNLPYNTKRCVNGDLSAGQSIKRPSDALQARSTALAPTQSPGAAGLSDRPVAPLLPQALIASEVTTQTPAESSGPEHVQDASDQTTPQECDEYELEIVACLFAEETLHIPRPDYMASQAELNGNLRAILVDWLVEVHSKYKLRRKVLYLTASLIDRYLALEPVARKRLQLVGVACMLIAAKFEEINPPLAADFAYITDKAYTKEEVLGMESTIFAALFFSIVVPTQADFLDYLLKADQGLVEKHKELVNYLVELALVDIRMIRHAPSKLVSAALLLSNEIMGRPAWLDRMAQISRYSEMDLRGCAEELRGLLRADRSSTLLAIRDKYTLQRPCSIARLPQVLAA